MHSKLNSNGILQKHENYNGMDPINRIKYVVLRVTPVFSGF
jgi:hypothetical protein